MRRSLVWTMVLLLFVGGAAALVWMQKDELWVWWQSRSLENASPAELEQAVDRLAAFEAVALPALVRQLESKDDSLCAGSGRAISRLLARRDANDSRAIQLIDALATRFSRLGAEGQRQALLLALERMMAAGEAAAPNLICAAGKLASAACAETDGRRLPALKLALILLPSQEGEPLQSSCRTLAIGALRSPMVDERVLAVKLAAFPALDLIEQLPPLISGDATDPSAEVRTVAILTLGNREALLPTETILPLLHDRDEEVRTVAEQALRTRGLPPAQLRLAQMLANPNPAVRARVPGELLKAPELDGALWLEKLSGDPVPSVRAAALRVAVESSAERGREWLRRACELDASPTVQDIARFYGRDATWARKPQD